MIGILLRLILFLIKICFSFPKNEIMLIIKEKGLQTLFNDTFPKPKEIKINNATQTHIDYKYELTESENRILLTWDTPLPTCERMFYNLENITYIDLSNFDGSGVNTMHEMFCGCTNLKSINLNINTSIAKNMQNIFCNCTSLEYVDLSKLNTESVRTMVGMFSNCISLTTLDLSNFDTKNVESMENMFYGAKSLLSLDLSTFAMTSNKNMKKMFYDCTSLKYLNMKNFSDKQNLEVDDIFSDNLKNLVYCIDEGVSPKILEVIKSVNQNNDCNDPCFSSLEDNKCIEYSENSEVIENKKTIYLTEIIEINSTNNLINTEKEVKNDDITEYFEDETNKETNSKFSSEEFFKEGHVIDDKSIKNKDKIIDNIRKDLSNGKLDNLLFNLTNGTKQDLLVQSKDIIYQITTTENQKNNEYKNISTIDLNLCEERLKAQNNISEDESLIIFKVDYYVPGLLIPVIGYEVYHPTKNYKLELSNCNDILVNLDIPISINENTLFKHDPNSDYYTDECFSYTTEDGTDIILNDRYNEYNDNNLSICESNCTLNKYNSKSKKAICECHTKTKIDSISDIINNDNILSSNFNKDNSTTNFGTMKCMDTLFSKEGLLSNLGSYLFIFNLCFFSISSIIYFKCGNQIIINMLKQNKSIKIKKQSTQKLNIYNGKKIVKGKKRKKRKSKSMKLSNRISNPLKRISKKSIDNPRSKYYKREMSELICSKSVLKNNTNLVLNFEPKDEKEIKINKKGKDEIKIVKYKNCELNSFPYKKALIYDKRTFRQTYFYLLLIKQPILFSFYPNDDYNLTIIKISLFFLSLDIYLVVNAFFFSKSKIHQIYEDGGNYNFSYFFPQIIYSFFISFIVINFIKYFSLSENNILEIKNEENIKIKNDKIEKVRKCLIIKYLLFYIISLVFIIIFFYYLSSFCAVYKNTQVFVVKNTLISFLIFLLFPMLFAIMPCCLRIFSLKNNNNEGIYKFSNYLQLL